MPAKVTVQIKMLECCGNINRYVKLISWSFKALHNNTFSQNPDHGADPDELVLLAVLNGHPGMSSNITSVMKNIKLFNNKTFFAKRISQTITNDWLVNISIVSQFFV